MYEYSLELVNRMEVLMQKLCFDQDPTKTLQQNQALAKLFGQILNFVTIFDQLKMRKPEIQNDFSYYRRSMGRMKTKGVEIVVKDELANKMSLFFAYPTPMLNVLIEIMTSFLEQEKGKGILMFKVKNQFIF